jgi:DNA (cytosine-5)-methyltransferase 1
MAAPRCLELFAGAGGAALGLGAAGLEHAALCEWDRHACATLRAAGLGPVVEGDVRDLQAIAAVAGESVDVLWSSFPCQAWSTAGARRGAADERNGWPWTVDAVDRFKPAWFLGENVRGLLLHRSGCTAAGGQRGLFGTAPAEDCPGCYFERVILPDLRARFACVGWWLLDAADFGVPQHRRRVILWAGPAPLVEPAPTHGPGRARGWVSMREALGVEAFCFATHPEGAEGVADRRVRRLSDGPCPTIGAEYTGTLAGHPWVGSAFYPRGRHGALAWEEVPLDGPANAVSCGPCGVPWVDAAVATGRRRLTVAECARLQDFPAGHPWQGGVGAQYRQVGNAVPPRLAEVVGRALMGAIEDVRGLS